MSETKPSWDNYYLTIAIAASARSSCERSKVGAVVVTSQNRIASVGYNDAPPKRPGCEACPRRLSGVPSGSDYDNCVALHAEMNALLYCDRADLIGSTLYITRDPCVTCSKAIEGAGVAKVVTKGNEGEANGISELGQDD